MDGFWESGKWSFMLYMITVLGLIGTLGVIITYIVSILRIFGMASDDESDELSGSDIFNRGWKILFWILIFALLVFIYCDFSVIFLSVLSGINDSTEKAGIFLPFFSHFIFRSRGIYGFIISLVAKSSLLIPMLIAVRGLSSNQTDGKQPAYKQYFFGQALTDLKNVVFWTTKFIATLVGKIALGVAMGMIVGLAHGGCIFIVIMGLIWPFALGLLLSLAVVLIMAFLMMGIIAVLHSIGVLIVLVFSLYFAAMFYLAERFLMFIRSGYVKCPYAGCYTSIALPVYVCPHCGKKHDKLIPGKYGVFKRTCLCGHELKTLNWLGKDELVKLCPVCNKPLSDELFGGNIHLPIFGGTSVGKTMFRMATAWQLLEGKLNDVKANLIDDNDKIRYRDIWKKDFEKGIVREKTQEMIPDAFLMKITKDGGLPVSLYMYDPAGEAMFNDIELQGYKFLKYFDGLALLLDPLSLPTMRKKYESKTGRELPLTASLDDPGEMINQIIIVLERLANLSRGKKFNRRVAIVLTKADDPVIKGELGIKKKLSDKLPEGNWSNIGKVQSKQIRKWMSENEPALYQQINTRFGDARFFMVSSLGHSPEEDAPFAPKQVMNPICWLLSKRQVLSHPRFTKLLTQIAEFTAVCATYMLFVGALAVAGIAIVSMIL